MKNIFIFTLILCFQFFFSQGTLYFHNFSNYEIEGRLFARGNNGCYPAVWTSYEFPANLQTEIKSYNESLPIIDKWYVRTSPTGTITPQFPANSGLLNVMKNLTRWQFTWFLTKDTNGVQTGDQFWMGDDAFSAPCGTTPVYDYQHGNNGNTDVYWFYLPTTNETYLIIQ